MSDGYSWVDTNSDGLGDQGSADTDGDGVVDTVRVDSNFDGLVDQTQLDTDHDGYRETVAVDLDQDGANDGVESDTNRDGVLDTTWTDVDHNGVSESVSHDDNGDGVVDRTENDANQDGVIDQQQSSGGVQGGVGLNWSPSADNWMKGMSDGGGSGGDGGLTDLVNSPQYASDPEFRARVDEMLRLQGHDQHTWAAPRHDRVDEDY